MTENEGRETAPEGTDLARGLPMVSRWDPEALEEEKTHLRELGEKGAGARWGYYWARQGPGWMQSALTLGGGSAASSLFAGAFLEYRLLWLQPTAMALGIIAMSAVAYQTVMTGIRPFQAMSRFVHPVMAWLWALGSLAATVIWHFPQYTLAGAVCNDMVKAASAERVDVPPIVFAVVVLGIATWITFNYGKSARGIRIYERTLKYMVWGIVFAFLVVIIKNSLAGRINWGAVGRGYVGFYIPPTDDPRGVSVLMGAFGAAVGINMTFLFPYTLLARGWSREHRGLAQFDLIVGMLIPFALATSLMMIATASTIYGTEHVPAQGTGMSPVQAAQILANTTGLFVGRFIFGLGILGMALSTITLHMLVSAFIVCEVMGWEPTGWHYRLGALIPAVGVLGPVLWDLMKLMWVPVIASVASGLLLPIAYIGFWILMNRRAYLGEAKPTGGAAALWNLGLGLATIAALSSASYYIWTNVITKHFLH